MVTVAMTRGAIAVGATSDYGGKEVTYHWRRANLVVEAHVDCFGFCPGDVDAAARAWVDAIDNPARASL